MKVVDVIVVSELRMTATSPMLVLVVRMNFVFHGGSISRVPRHSN